MGRIAAAVVTLCWLLAACGHPSGRAGTSPTPTGAAFAFGTQGRYAWALTGRGLELSDDAGGSWRVARAPGEPTGYAAAARWGANEVWLAAAGRHATTLYRSTDGGVRWTARTFAGPGPEVRVTAALVSASDGFLVLAQPETAITSVVRIYATSDGGATFEQRRGPQETGPVEFSSPTNGALVPSFAGTEIYVTSDGARHWRKSRLVGFPGRYTLGAPLASGGASRVPVLLGHGAAAFGIASSSNGGRTYRLPGRASPALPPAAGAVVAASRGATVWAVPSGGARLYSSGDRGRSWSTITPRGLRGSVSELALPTAARGLALVQTGGCRGDKTDCVQRTTLEVSADGGRTWHPARL